MEINDTTEAVEPEEKFDLKKEIISWIKTIAVSLIVVFLVITFVGRVVKVDGYSMEPTLNSGDRLIVTNIHGDLKRNDIVAIKRENDTSLVKRIIAVEGDTIDINFDTSEVFVNDVLLHEDFINEPTTNQLDFEGPQTVPQGHVFVMGDNRNHSEDSRHSAVGMIDEKNIFGKVIFRISPFNNIGLV